MQTGMRLSLTFAAPLVLTVLMAWPGGAQNIKSGVVNSRDQILGATTTQQKQSQKQFAQNPPAGKGNLGPLPCNSNNNPKCDTVSPSKPGDRGNNGVGNGVDP